MQSIDIISARLNSMRNRVGAKMSDLLAAITRRTIEADAGLRANLRRRMEGLHAGGERLSPSIERAMFRERERFETLLAILRAKDFRHNGWTIATNSAGEPMRSVNQLAADQKLTLHLVDGTARVITEQIEKEALND